MQIQFDRLVENVRLLGNHHLKYLRNIEANKDHLIESLEAKGKIDQVHLWKSAQDISGEMDVILEVGDSLQEKLYFLGCYFALQFLHMNLMVKDVLVLDLTSSVNRNRAYRDFMFQSGLKFRSLSTCYMKRLLDLFIPDEERPEFVMCAVGTRADQDDIDIGIVDDGSEKRGNFTKAIGKLRAEMLKYASCLHFYLSEHVGTQGYSASIYEYRQLLDKEIHDFIIITEMLGAAPVLGSEALFDQFKREITWRYHYDRKQDNKYHEGYLRGILGEIRSLLIRQVKPDSLHLKDDGLRMLKSMIYVEKTIFQIDKVNFWEIINELRMKDPIRRETYDRMERALTFLEIFRHLTQLFVIQEEEIILGETATADNMAPVAECMGYKDVGGIKAWDHLLIHYYEHVQLAKDIVGTLLKFATEHLESISVFSILARYSKDSEEWASEKRNLAVDFSNTSRFFRGTKFWDDILEALEADDGELLERFVTDFNSLEERYRKNLVERYGACSTYTFYAFISFLVILSENQRRLKCQGLCEDLNMAFLNTAEKTEDRISKLAKLFYQYPKLINEYLMTLDDEKLIRVEKILEQDVWETEIAVSKEKLKRLCQLHYRNSRYFKRFFIRVVRKYPKYVQYLDQTEKLRQIAKGLLGMVDNLNDCDEKIKALGDYYDLEFLRVGLETLQGVPIGVTNTEFTEFSDTYLQVLFDVCKQCVDEEIGEKVATRDLLAVFAAGGHAREQAYDDDYDIIILLNSRDEDMRKYCNRIVTRMNSEIIKRGTLPHYRFADHFGHFVTLIDDLDVLLSQDHAEAFIDKSQILGSRMVIGSRKFEKDFIERIIHPHIFSKSREYISQMIAEIESRHRDRRNMIVRDINVKEGIGGLRDIEMILLIYKAKFGLREPINRKLMATLAEIDMRRGEDFRILADAFDFLKNVRDIYRLTVSAGDVLRPEYLGRAAEILGFKHKNKSTPIEQLLADYHKCSTQVARIVDRMLMYWEK
ncbi:MAG: hypothetical protein GTO51_10275 [Candidatus Latescibacteria bacterium]|nr:hypothetical protein [Candidatus Latescibacterota bacterium]NIM66353.1 hypothetical protein [Candidatus Latescibacterota bacterium]NIO02832.1 hypothetical protein [Candidatus Latescibacterota bacterium]NIO29967.1 hypothetical protein [Candidatus Latescibacterota bacterium]NIO57582.1 hypothetical protein [Candidatus Latescibacterota bacterium]